MSIATNGFVLAMSHRYLLAICICALSVVFHKWAPFLGALGIAMVVVTNIEFSLVRNGGLVSPRPSKTDLLVFLLGCLAMVAIKVIGVFGLFTLDLPMIGEFKHYLIGQDQYESLERVNGLTKAALLAVLVIVSEVVLGATEDANLNKARSLRRKVLMFILPLAAYPEIFSRVLVVYWVSELIFIVSAFATTQTRIRLSAALIFCSYGVAPNALNVIIGPVSIFSF